MYIVDAHRMAVIRDQQNPPSHAKAIQSIGDTGGTVDRHLTALKFRMLCIGVGKIVAGPDGQDIEVSLERSRGLGLRGARDDHSETRCCGQNYF